MSKNIKLYYNKLEIRKKVAKYCGLVLLVVPVLILLNFTLFEKFSMFWKIFCNVLLLLGYIGVLYFNIEKRKEKKKGKK